jgi:hypothetical protein
LTLFLSLFAFYFTLFAQFSIFFGLSFFFLHSFPFLVYPILIFFL